MAPIGRLDEQRADLPAHAVDVNLGGVVHGWRAAVDGTRPQGRGHIVNIASVPAVNPFAGFALYMVESAAAACLRPRLVPTLSPDQVADAVSRVLPRPRPQVFVPRSGRPPTYAALLPARLQDAVDSLLRTDHIALKAYTVARTTYESEPRKRVTTP